MLDRLLAWLKSSKATKSEGQPSEKDIDHVARTLKQLATFGILGSLLFAIATNATAAGAVAVFGGALILSWAAALAGGLIGFVFAIPRSRQEQVSVKVSASDDNQKASRPSDYSANTNLEQISDWLTKILVGIGLVQFDTFWNRGVRILNHLTPLMGNVPAARPATLSLTAYFVLWGFFFAYLATRLWLPKALSRAERDEEDQRREVEEERDMRAVQSDAYEALYQGAPGGFTRAIDLIEKYHDKPGSLRSGWLWTYLAAAYGQKHKYEKDAGHSDAANAVKQKAVTAVEEALRLDPGTKPVLQQIYRGSDENENDLKTLQGDERLDQLLGR